MGFTRDGAGYSVNNQGLNDADGHTHSFGDPTDITQNQRLGRKTKLSFQAERNVLGVLN